MGLVKEEDINGIKQMFDKELNGPVNIMYFYGSKEECRYCNETMEIIETIAGIDKRIKVTKYDIKLAEKEAKYLGVDNVPAIVIGGKRMYSMIYYGIPAGYEFSSLLEDIIDASRGATRLSEAAKEAARSITTPLDIKVFVTPSCPYCPKVVRTAHQFAMENPKIKSMMVEATEFQELSAKYNVMGVPKTVINDSIEFVGMVPEETFLNYLMQAAGKA